MVLSKIATGCLARLRVPGRKEKQRSIVKEFPPLSRRSHQMICSVSFNFRFCKALNMSVILPFSPGSQERWLCEDIRSWEGGWLTSSLSFIVSVCGIHLPREIREHIFSQGFCFYGTQFPRNCSMSPLLCHTSLLPRIFTPWDAIWTVCLFVCFFIS